MLSTMFWNDVILDAFYLHHWEFGSQLMDLHKVSALVSILHRVSHRAVGTACSIFTYAVFKNKLNKMWPSFSFGCEFG